MPRQQLASFLWARALLSCEGRTETKAEARPTTRDRTISPSCPTLDADVVRHCWSVILSALRASYVSRVSIPVFTFRLIPTCPENRKPCEDTLDARAFVVSAGSCTRATGSQRAELDMRFGSPEGDRYFRVLSQCAQRFIDDFDTLQGHRGRERSTGCALLLLSHPCG